MKHKPQITYLHPALSCAAASIFLQLYLKPAVPISFSRFFFQVWLADTCWLFIGLDVYNNNNNKPTFSSAHNMDHQLPLQWHELSLCHKMHWCLSCQLQLTSRWVLSLDLKEPGDLRFLICLMAAGSMLLERTAKIVVQSLLLLRRWWGQGHPAWTIAVRFCHWPKKQADKFYQILQCKTM